MELTAEQKAILHSDGNLLINAVAGSGKTTTLIEYARARPSHCRILYLAFNKSVKEEAIRRFAQAGLKNVTVETAHSLAYRHVVSRDRYTVRHSYKSYEIAEILGLDDAGERHGHLMVASHINRFIAYFCNSDKQKVQELDYREIVADEKAKSFVTKCYAYIEKQTRHLLAKMDRGEIEIVHDFYLKKFQLSKPELKYDYILFDEAQDASAAMLDVFFNQKAVKVIVGDTHQQIYGWRFAVNSMATTSFPVFNLNSSFRFGQEIGDLAMNVLSWKSLLGQENKVLMEGKGSSGEVKSKAVIARSNLGLLLKAINYAAEDDRVKKIYFEGNLNSYTYADDGASLYDVLSLYNYRHHMVKDKVIKQMKSFSELKEYVEKTEDRQLGMLVEIVEQYGSEIPGLLKSIKEKNVENRADAEIIFSTVHKSKGLEYDAVELADDFMNEEDLEKAVLKKNCNDRVKARLNEEINLLYVAITRARTNLYIPEKLIPEEFVPDKHIHALEQFGAGVFIPESKSKSGHPKGTCPPERSRGGSRGANVGHPERSRGGSRATDREKAYDLATLRIVHRGAYSPWTDALDDELTELYCSGKSAKEMAKHFGRTTGAIESRIKKLELEELYG